MPFCSQMTHIWNSLSLFRLVFCSSSGKPIPFFAWAVYFLPSLKGYFRCHIFHKSYPDPVCTQVKSQGVYTSLKNSPHSALSFVCLFFSPTWSSGPEGRIQAHPCQGSSAAFYNVWHEVSVGLQLNRILFLHFLVDCLCRRATKSKVIRVQLKLFFFLWCHIIMQQT